MHAFRTTALAALLALVATAPVIAAEQAVTQPKPGVLDTPPPPQKATQSGMENYGMSGMSSDQKAKLTRSVKRNNRHRCRIVGWAQGRNARTILVRRRNSESQALFTTDLFAKVASQGREESGMGGMQRRTVLKDGDHRLSRPQDIARMIATVLATADQVDATLSA